MSGPGYSPNFTNDYAASSPFTYQGAQVLGANAAATAGGLVSMVATPVVGFTQGFLQGRALLVLLAIGAIILLDKNGAK